MSFTRELTTMGETAIATEARDLLGAIEDELAAAGWPWNPAISVLVDALVVFAEQPRTLIKVT